MDHTGISKKATRADTLQYFSKRLKEMLSSRGLSQSELARRMTDRSPTGTTIGRDLVHNWTNARVLPRNENRDLLCEVLSCDMGELFPRVEVVKTRGSSAPVSMEVVGDGNVHLNINTVLPWDDAMSILKIIKTYQGD